MGRILHELEFSTVEAWRARPQGPDCWVNARYAEDGRTVSGWHQSVCGASGEDGARETGTRRRAGGSGVVECLPQWEEDHADHGQARQATIVSESRVGGRGAKPAELRRGVRPKLWKLPSNKVEQAAESIERRFMFQRQGGGAG